MDLNELDNIMKKNPNIRVNKKDQQIVSALRKTKGNKTLKYKNKPGYLDGYYFDSKAEQERYGELVLLKMAKDIVKFKVHPRYKISANKYYEADFEVHYPDGHIEVEDVKGFETQTFKLKADLFKEKYPSLKLIILKNK